MNRASRLWCACVAAACLSLLVPREAAAGSRKVAAGQVVGISEDLVLSGDDVLEVNGTLEKPCRLDGNCQQIRTAPDWRGHIKVSYCQFRGLGTAKLPALDVTARGKGDRIIIENSEFHACGAVYLATLEDSGAIFRKNTLLANSMVPVTNLPNESPPGFRASGRSSARKLFQGNRVDKSIVQFENTNNWLIGGSADDEGNVILGMRGSLSLYGCEELLVRGNYIHTEIPSSRWSQVHTLLVGNCKKLVTEHNVIRHGQWVVRGLSGEFRYNLVLDADAHNFIIGPTAGTHIHHNIFARYCTVDHNLNSTINLAYKGDDIQIFNNTFDGGGKDIARPWSVPAIEVGADAFLAYADYNAFFNPDAKEKQNYAVAVKDKTERTDDGFAKHDLPASGEKNAQVEPKFAGSLPKKFPFKDEDIRSGKATVAQILAHYRAAYAPADDSPLIGAGDPADGLGSFIGAVGGGKNPPNDYFGRLAEQKK